MSRLSVRTKLALGFLLAGLLPLLVFALVTEHFAEDALRDQAAAEMQNRNEALGAALASRKRAILDQVVSYGEWSAFSAAVERRDVAWLEDNATTWVVENSEMTGAQALTRDGTVVSAAGDFNGVSLFDSPIIATAVKTGQNTTEFRMIDGRLFIIGAGPIVEQGTEDSGIHGIVLFGEPVDEARLAELASIIGASELDLYKDGRLQASSADSTTLTLPAGTPLDTAIVSGSDVVLLTELRDSSGQPQAVIGLRVDSAAIAVTGATTDRHVRGRGRARCRAPCRVHWSENGEPAPSAAGERCQGNRRWSDETASRHRKPR